MRLLAMFVLVGVVALMGCATDRAGWSGAGATPFDAAQADCDAKTRALAAGKVREDAFDTCMAGHGWRRP